MGVDGVFFKISIIFRIFFRRLKWDYWKFIDFFYLWSSFSGKLDVEVFKNLIFVVVLIVFYLFMDFVVDNLE